MFASEGCVHAIDSAEAPVVAYVIVVSVRVHYTHRQIGQAFYNLLDIADAHAGIEQQSLFFSDDQVRNNFFLLVRFVNSEQAGTNAIHLEPSVRHVYALQLAVGWAREFAAPLWFLPGLRSEESKEYACGKMHLFS